MFARLLKSLRPEAPPPATDAKQRGDAFLKAGQLDQAEQAYRQAVAERPGDARARFTLGYTLSERGRAVEAIEQLDAALAIDPRLIDAHYVIATLHHAAGRADAAVAHFEQALALDPANAFARRDLEPALLAQAKSLADAGRRDDALRCHHRLVELSPESAQYHFERGNLQLALQRPADAEASFARVVALMPGLASAHSNRALALTALDRPEEALLAVDRALALAPDFSAALSSRPMILVELGRHVEALEACERALRIDPRQPSLLNCRGIAMQELRRPADALPAYDAALRLKPDYPAALINRSTTLLGLNRFEQALSDLQRAEALAPELADTHYARGNVLQELARHEEAVASFARALEMQPEFEEAHLNQGISLLSLGEFERGWAKYERRWRCRGWRNSQGLFATRTFAAPLWLGQASLAGKTILLHPEQGLGDTIQFSRYATHLSERGAKVLLEVQPPLKQLLRDLAGVASVSGDGEELPTYDFHSPLLSLPFACKTRLDSIPSPGPYLGDSNRHRARLADWSEKLGPRSRPRIGLAWSGNPWHRNDANRSVPFADIAGLLSADLEFCCLQNELRDSEREAAVRQPNIRFFCDDLTDFSETAALIGHLDLVICIDTSIAHLAGALGAPTWLLLPANPDFRWMLDRADSPWYSSMRLIRQQRLGSWKGEMATLQRELELMAA